MISTPGGNPKSAIGYIGTLPALAEGFSIPRNLKPLCDLKADPFSARRFLLLLASNDELGVFLIFDDEVTTMSDPSGPTNTTPHSVLGPLT
jgi:hypothetical protein